MQQMKRFSPNVPTVLPQDRTDYALNFYFSFYCCLPKEHDTQRGLFDCLYPIWEKSAPSSPLRPIVAAVASVMLDAWLKIKPNQPFSLFRPQYIQGVAALREKLRTADHASDEIIMAALMLDMYESLTSFLVAQRNKGLHMSGATALIESRRKQPITDESSQRLILGIRNQVVGRALAGADAVPSIVSSWAQIMSDIPMTPGSLLDGLNIEVANVQALTMRLVHDDKGRKDIAIRVLKRATELDQQLSIWTENLPADWPPIRVSGPECIPQSVREAGLYQDYCDIYKSIFVADTFNAYYSSRIKLQLAIITCLECLDSDSSNPAITAALLIVQDLADTICASIPFHLGDRTVITRIDDMSVQFPCAGGRPNADNHHTTSAAFAGFYLSIQLPKLLAPNVQLRLGQKQWVGGQLGRLKRVYNIQTS